MVIGLRAVGEIGDRLVMSPEVTEELIARQPPEAQAIIRILLAPGATGGSFEPPVSLNSTCERSPSPVAPARVLSAPCALSGDPAHAADF